MKLKSFLIIFSLFFFASISHVSAAGFKITLDPPGEREFVRDLANLINPADKDQIKQLCDKLLTDKATPIIVVTIESMAKHCEMNMNIEAFATLLFNQWQIGHAKLGEQDWNTGILLLVSKNDRRARIELGSGWGREEDALCQKIMDEHIIFHFKNGEFSKGILAGVEALDKMGRELELPTRPRPWWHYGLIVGFIGLFAFTIVSLIRKGSSGWAWVFWGIIFTILGALLYNILTNSGNSSGGGFSGGSFGGGFSGGGGASGSW